MPCRSTILPCALGIGGLLPRAREVHSIRRVEIALRPLVVGFMAAAAFGIVRAQLGAGVLPLLLVGTAAALAYAYDLLRPVPLMLTSGAAYWTLCATLLAR